MLTVGGLSDMLNHGCYILGESLTCGRDRPDLPLTLPLTVTMLVYASAPCSPPIALNHVRTTAVNGLPGLAATCSSNVSLAQLRSVGASDGVQAVVQLLERLPSLRRINLIFAHRPICIDSAMPAVNAAHFSSSLCHAAVTSGTSTETAALIQHATALEWLAISYRRVPQSDIDVAVGTLPKLRRLILRVEELEAEPAIFYAILASAGTSLRSVTIRVNCKASLAAIQHLADRGLTDGLVHLALQAHAHLRRPSLVSLDFCEHPLEARQEEVQQACDFIRACPRLAHLSLQSFHPEDVPAILGALHRPLVSLGLQSVPCVVLSDSPIIRHLFDSDDMSVIRLRFLAVDRPLPVDEWLLLRGICASRRITRRPFGDLVLLLIQKGVRKFGMPL